MHNTPTCTYFTQVRKEYTRSFVSAKFGLEETVTSATEMFCEYRLVCCLICLLECCSVCLSESDSR